MAFVLRCQTIVLGKYERGWVKNECRWQKPCYHLKQTIPEKWPLNRALTKHTELYYSILVWRVLTKGRIRGRVLTLTSSLRLLPLMLRCVRVLGISLLSESACASWLMPLLVRLQCDTFRWTRPFVAFVNGVLRWLAPVTITSCLTT